jgi:regulator of sigma E protease
MEIFLIRLLQFMLAISLLVLLHEGGHFLASKLFGVRVEKFYLFFDPWFHLFEFKPKHSDTTYGIGWLPLGGYCKISGMIDESFDSEQMKLPPQKWEFRCKPAWQRLIIMVAGVLVNFITALFIYAMVLFHWGDSYVAVKDMSLGMKFNKEAKALGFQDHDILLGTDKGTFKDFNADLYRGLAEAHRCDIIRNGRHISIAMPGDINMIGMLKTQPKFVQWFTPSTVDSVMKGSPAEKIGMLKNDSIIEFNGRKIDSYNEFQNEIGRIKDVLASANTHSDSLKALTTTVAFVHKGDTSITKKPVTLSSDVLIGIAFTNVLAEYKTTHITYTFLSSLPAGIKYGWDVLKGYVDDFKYVFTADGAKSLGGFGAIGSLFPPMWDWHAFWMMTAFLSIILAFMNILPIPALDGGHVFFLCYEMITRRKPSDKFMIRAEYVGITILLLLMIVANMNDILRWLGYM